MPEVQTPVLSKPPSKWRHRLFYSLLSLVVSLLAVEIFVRTAWPVHGCVLGLHGEYLHAPIPNSSTVQFMEPTLASGGIVVRVNSHGMLGPEPDAGRKRPRVMVFGDSFVMSENEPYAKTFAAQLGKQWEGRIEVLSAGVTGYGPDQTLLRMGEFLPRYEPDGVVLVLCGYNDLGDPIRNHLVHLDKEGELIFSKAGVRAEERDWFEENLADSKRWGLDRLWRAHREVTGWQVATRGNTATMADYLRAHREDHLAHTEMGETAAIGLLRDVYDADVALKPEWPSSRYKVRLMEAILKEIASLCRSASIPLIAVVVPGGPDMDPESWLKVDTKHYPDYKRDTLSNQIAGASGRAGIQTLNLFSTFDGVARDVDLYVGPVDPHWNANGMGLGAESCAQFLVGNRDWPFLN
ncbi:MAG: GDSL-type esterase/lipase family protein [Planctomycetota bacterium]|nr:GDSL-type esterase/lipase family protein [Planctomycetota bacterium]